MGEKTSATIEDYLGVLFILHRDGEPVVGTRLAELLGVTPPTVTNTLKRMARDGLVDFNEPHGPHLTDSGLEVARSVMRRHMLTEWMLVRMLNVSWSRSHSEAHQIEHTISEDIEELMRRNLDDPEICPHGNPLPGFEHVAAGWIPLSEAHVGERVIIRRIHEMAEDKPDLLRYLEANNIIPGARAVISEVLSFNQTITLDYEGRKVMLGFQSAQYIYIEKITE